MKDMFKENFDHMCSHEESRSTITVSTWREKSKTAHGPSYTYTDNTFYNIFMLLLSYLTISNTVDWIVFCRKNCIEIVLHYKYIIIDFKSCKCPRTFNILNYNKITENAINCSKLISSKFELKISMKKTVLIYFFRFLVIELTIYINPCLENISILNNTKLIFYTILSS